MLFLVNFVFNFHSGIYITTKILVVNVYLMQNMKKPIEIRVSMFFHNIGPTFAQILSQRPQLLYFYGWSPMNMLGDIININNLCCNPAVLKKSL